MKMYKTKQYDICIIGGCGRAGLPLGLAFADRGQKVVLYDINQSAVEKINKKMMPFLEEGGPEILLKVVDLGMLVATSDISVISMSENLVMVTGTPVDEHQNPRVQDVMEIIERILHFLRYDHLLILRSTVYPGITQKISNYLKLKGRQTGVAFCPERTAEGYALRELSMLPQIVSAFDKNSLKRAKALFHILAKKVGELSPVEAELAKLFANAWRYVNFAISNQFYMIADSYGLDFYRIYEAMVKNYPRLQGFAKAGLAAGPCLFKDTMQLSAFSNNNFFMGHGAMLINEGLPNYIVGQLKVKIALKEKIVGILGMAFKANNDDPRDSLS